MKVYIVSYTALTDKFLRVTKVFKKRKSAVGSVRKWKKKGELYGASFKETTLIG